MPKVGMQPIRRQQLIEATLTAIDRVGMGDASIALIARLAGVSNGIISHYFQDKNGLIAATMRYLMDALIENVQERRRALKDDSPRAHLQVIIEGNFDASQVNGPAMKTWLAFWATSMMRRSAASAASKALMLLGRPTKSGMTMCGKTTMSRSGSMGRSIGVVGSGVFPDIKFPLSELRCTWRRRPHFQVAGPQRASGRTLAPTNSKAVVA